MNLTSLSPAGPIQQLPNVVLLICFHTRGLLKLQQKQNVFFARRAIQNLQNVIFRDSRPHGLTKTPTREFPNKSKTNARSAS